MTASAPPSDMTPSVERDGRTLYLAPGVTVAPADIEDAFRWLDQWELAVPLRPYDQLAQDFGDEDERALTKSLVLDLRQLVYDWRALFVRESPRTNEMLATWEEEKAHCRCDGFCPLPFLRAYWRVKPMLDALPAGWIIEEAKAV